MQPTLQTINLSKTYRSRKSSVQALKDVSFEMKEGEILALVGPNGAGKTTLLKILLDLVHPTSGEAFLHGLSTDEPDARRNVGYLPEMNELPESKTPAKFLHLMGSLAGAQEEDFEPRIEPLLEEVGLASVTQPIKAFSKGMKRRLALAQALLHEPDVLLLDEPTDGLDPLERERVTTLLRRLADDGASLLVCSHVLPEVEGICDRFLILYKGSCRRLGTVEELEGTTLQEAFIEAVREN